MIRLTLRQKDHRSDAVKEYSTETQGISNLAAFVHYLYHKEFIPNQRKRLRPVLKDESANECVAVFGCYHRDYQGLGSMKWDEDEPVYVTLEILGGD